LVLGILLGMLVERLIVRPLYSRPLDAILATCGLSIVVVQLITIGFGRGTEFVLSPLQGAVALLGTSYSLYRLAMLVVALVIGGAIAAILQGTRLGLAARAVIMNETLAQSLGINSTLVRFATFSVGAGLATMAGSLITPLLSIDPLMGVPWLLNAFMLVMVSGTSLLSLAVASVVLGGAQVVVSTYGNPVLGALTIVVLAALLLRIRPTGFARA
jgi:branched-chain amino acid transport system permease protein